ncbi:MAG: ABC transporter permease, partial [bacterium]|nr:ABC transporter permease [bacterium]
MRKFTFAKGTAFTEGDVASLNRVAVLGSKIAETLFGQLDPVGKTIRLRDTTFRVLGVLEEKGVGPFGVDQDSLIVIPISVAQKQLLGMDYYSVVNVEANDAYDIEFAKARVISVLRTNHHITDPSKDDFTVRTQADAVALLGDITSILTIFLTAIACISLIVGGIGIMNIMLVSVVERTSEIGLRKALGATKNDILQQFLTEAMMLTLIGGIIGIIIGAVFDVLIYEILIRFADIDWVFALPLQAILLAVGVSSVIGLVFGIYPARQAANKSPMDALRYE